MTGETVHDIMLSEAAGTYVDYTLVLLCVPVHVICV